MATRVLVIDNYDSFVYNLVQYLGELGADPVVFRNDELAVEDIGDIDPDGILVSPGPGVPSEAGISNEVIRTWGPRTPILGVCLGMQCIGEVHGAIVGRAAEVVHGKTSVIDHDGKGVFAGVPDPLEATRYHSLVVDRDSVPDVLEVSASTSDGIVMGLRHKRLPIEGVQFHPESVLSDAGHEMVANFIGTCSR